MAENGRVAVFSSENRANIAVYPLDVFVLTDLGAAQLQGGATALPPEALGLLVLMDGKATIGDLEQKAPHIGSEALRDLVRALLGGGMLRAATLTETDADLNLDIGAFLAAGSAEPTAAAQASADREAQNGAPQLERSGYYVSIARRAVKAKIAQGAKWRAFVVEDDPDMAELVARLLAGAGFEVSVAARRDEVVAGLRQPPLPDVVILDVMLPDVNGFDILQKLKAHPALKAVPVIMLTADAARESVMRGLAGGADGYITKPFERAKLLDGVRAVLGIGV
jgi:two-component system OmpR family response regulator